MASQGTEERRHPRFDVFLPLACHPPGWPDPRGLEGKAKDLGQGGIRMLLPTPVAPQTVLLDLRMPGGLLRVGGEVRWVGPLQQSDLGGHFFPHGVRFLRLLSRSTVEEVVTHQLALRQLPQHPRTPVELPVEYAITDRFVATSCLNISRGGIYVQTPDPPPLNREIILRFTIPGDSVPLRLRGRVVWSNPHAGRNPFPPGMGVQFLDLGAAQAARLDDFIASLRRRGIASSDLLRPWYVTPEEPTPRSN
ncbi:MAG TPA: TIGR02266 family protein [Candidatus Methylomirabilis sp.]|nr:TIGR02266 family protein [Candidatus Methylomirabilis sp.]